MGYQQGSGSRRGSGRGYGTPRHEKSKAKKGKHHSADSSMLERSPVETAEEVVARTLRALSNLGSQRFGSSPYGEHYDLWLTDLRFVLAEFESSPGVGPDDQFINERSQILSSVASKLDGRHRKEASLDDSVKNLSDDKILLERIKEEYDVARRDVDRRKDSEVKRLKGDIDMLRGELDSNARIKTGLFRGVSEKTKRQKEAELTQRLDAAEKELELAMLNFTTVVERLRDEFEKKKQPVIKRIGDNEAYVEDLEIDGSVEDRRAACEALISAVNSLLQRKALQLQ